MAKRLKNSYIPLKEDDIRFAVDVPTKQIKEKDIIKVEKEGRKIEKKSKKRVTKTKSPVKGKWDPPFSVYHVERIFSSVIESVKDGGSLNSCPVGGDVMEISGGIVSTVKCLTSD